MTGKSTSASEAQRLTMEAVFFGIVLSGFMRKRTVTAMADTCGDNRFELIEKYKQKLLDATNIEDSPEEMAVIDNILFRFWQMGWLDRLELFGNSEQLEKDHIADPGNMVGDLISRQAAMRGVNGLIDHFERILRDIRETQVDDSVCGMCEYDGAFVGQSGDWCNECPGFEKDDCFKLSDECRKRWLKEAIDGVEK